MLRGMPVANGRAPTMLSYLDLVVLDDAPIGKWELRHKLGVAVARGAHARGALLVEAVLAKNGEHRVRGVSRPRAAHGMRRQVFPLRRPELRAIAGAEPRGVPRVVGVVVRENHPLHRPI